MEKRRQLITISFICLSIFCFASVATDEIPICANATVENESYCGNNETGIALELHIVRGDSNGIDAPGASTGKTGSILKWVAIGVGLFLLFLALTTMFANLIPILDPCGISGAICDFFKSWFCCSCSASIGFCTIS